MNGRSILRQEILLSGESDGVRFRRHFHIIKKISEGASVICYEAYHDQSGRGVLKEFYPDSIRSLHRDDEGQLICPGDTPRDAERFEQLAGEYLEPYEMLLRAKQADEENELSVFIPEFEIYRGIHAQDETAGSWYLWTPEPKLETFDMICETIHRQPDQEPEQKLVLILHAVETLTKCICALHCADMIHRDIKPSNFGFVKRGSETLTQNLSLFDIDTVCSVYARYDGVVGTPGYMEPEAGYEVFSNQTDIYAIGATLFHALIVTEETGNDGYLYRDVYYHRLQELVDQSALIRSSEANSHPRLRHILAGILQKSLCPRPSRYANCEELLEDLQEALYYALPSQIARQVRAGQRWVLADVEDVLNSRKKRDSGQLLRYYLYEHPLYRYLKSGETELNVLILGCGSYGQRFLDLCLQAGQIYGRMLHVVVLTEDAEDKAIYLSERPELARFFLLDGQGPDRQDAYGGITFAIGKMETADRKQGIDRIRQIIRNCFGGHHLHYAFIAFGEDRINEQAAEICLRAVSSPGQETLVCYACDDSVNPSSEESNDQANSMIPFYMNRELSECAAFSEMERMAMNVHLVWEKNLNVDYQAVRRDFRKGYNYNACLANVLSLKSKLFSIGIDSDREGFEQAAARFVKMTAGSDERNIILRDHLIWLEHRRWVTEKICMGWTGIRNLKDCLTGITRDERHKRHVCILTSRPDQMLAERFTNGADRSKWDQASDTEIRQLDELDQMSVMLHRMFRQRASELKKYNLVHGADIAGITRLIEPDAELCIAFREWHACMADIQNGETGKIRLYKGLRERFLTETVRMPKDLRKALLNQVSAFETLFYPILASLEYRDWKQDDTAMIDQIPFILTYTEDLMMAIPFVCGSAQNVFQNVASITLANPAEVLYMHLVRDNRDIPLFLEDLQRVTNYLRRKQLRAKVDVLFLMAVEINADLYDAMLREYRYSHTGNIRRISRVHVGSDGEIPYVVENFLRKKYRNRHWLMVEENDSDLSRQMQPAACRSEYPFYRYRSENGSFTSLNRGTFLQYIQKAPYLTITDLTVLGNGLPEDFQKPVYFEEIRTLWELYHSDPGAWKRLCSLMQQYSEQHDILAAFKLKSGRQKKQAYRYFLPPECRENVCVILNALKEHRIISSGSIRSCFADTCEVQIEETGGYRDIFDQLFSEIGILMIPGAVRMETLPDGTQIRVVVHRLQINGLVISEEGNVLYLCRKLQKQGFLIHVHEDSAGTIGFTCSSELIRRFLTDPVQILRAHYYEQIRIRGLYEDIAVLNQEILVMTKGFRTVFTAFADDPVQMQEVKRKLSAAGEQFGIHAEFEIVTEEKELEERDVSRL